MSIEVKKIVTDSFEMKYCKFGSGSKTAVILPGLSVKSVTDSADSIASAYGILRDDYTLYLFDRRTVCPPNYTIKDMADDTGRAFELLGLKDIYLFGVSQGGMIAQVIALDYPERVRKLALCSTIARLTEDNYNKVIKEWKHYAEQMDEEALNRSIKENVYSEGFAKEYGEFIMRFLSGITVQDAKRFVILAKGCEGFDVLDRLGEIKCPILVAGSKADKIFDYKYIAEIAEKTGARMITYENLGHALYDETPDFLGRLKEFFDE